MKRVPLWSWLWVVLAAVYFTVPLVATLDFSLRAQRGGYSFLAYQRVIEDPQFLSSFGFSLQMAVLTIVASAALIVPTAYWVHLRLPRMRPVLEFFTLLPFVVPAIVLVFGLIRVYSRPPLMMTASVITTNLLLIAGYMVISLPYMYRAVDVGLRSIDVRTLTEAAQSLGAGWFTVLTRVVLPNLRTPILSGSLLTVAIVIGELTLAQYLARPAFGPYMTLLGQNKAYEPAALAIMSFLMTWVAMGILLRLSRGTQGQIAGGR